MALTYLRSVERLFLSQELMDAIDDHIIVKHWEAYQKDSVPGAK